MKCDRGSLQLCRDNANARSVNTWGYLGIRPEVGSEQPANIDHFPTKGTRQLKFSPGSSSSAPSGNSNQSFSVFAAAARLLSLFFRRSRNLIFLHFSCYRSLGLSGGGFLRLLGGAVGPT